MDIRALAASFCSLIIWACSGNQATDPGTTSDVSEDASADDVAATEVGVDTVADTLDLGPPPEPAEAPLAIDWVMQSAHSDDASVGYPSTVGVSDGSLVVLSSFDGTITLGDRTVVSSTVPYRHGLYMRVAPSGEVAALTRICDGCLALGEIAMAALDEGQVAFSSMVDGEVVIAPGTEREATFIADKELFVAIVGVDGHIVRWRLVAGLPGYGTARALVRTADGGLVVAGDAFGLVIEGGPTFVPEPGWHYPGRAFIVGLDAELRPTFAEQLGGPAGSTIALLHLDGDALVTVGDFGGYPLGVTSVFGAGDDAITLAAVSSDDDPAMDIFVTRWRLPTGEGVGRLSPLWARRIAHYTNGPRTPTWIRGTGTEGEVELRIDGADRLEADEDGHVAAPWFERWATMIVRVDGAGAVVPHIVSPSALVPTADGFVSHAVSWQGSTMAPAGDAGPVFEVPATTFARAGADGVDWSGFVLGRWRSDGALVAAGLVLQRLDANHYPLSTQALVPQRDGSALVLMYGSAPVTLLPSAGEPIALDREPNYERFVVVRMRLVL